jgi:signal transduction histidine kinase
MNKLISKYNFDVSDSDELRLTKSLVLIVAASCSFCGIVWAGFYFHFFGFGLTTVIPIIFVAIVVPAIFISHSMGNYKLLVYAQLVSITLIPASIQWSLGSINDSGFVIAWCFLSPIGALLFLNQKSAKRWMLIFLIIVGVTAIGTPTLSSDAEKVTENVRTIFYLMNIGAPSIVIFIAASFFLKSLNQQREKNITLLKKAETSNKQLSVSLEKEQELGELKTNFVSMASHQFKTPLAIIQSNAELYEMLANTGKIIEPDKFTKISGRIKDAITTMSDLLTEILVLGKVTSGNLVYTPENVDLIELCEKLVEEFNLIQQDGRTLHFEIVGEPYKMQLDTKLLTHSLSNLISNAFKYSIGKENPKLTIQFKPTELVLSVKDFGLGITKKEQLHLFQPFFRAENVAEIKGTGLGLSIAKEYIEVSKGEITAKSILGEGSCFEITFKR